MIDQSTETTKQTKGEASDVERVVIIHPTQGGYQNKLTAKFVRETKTQIVVRPNGAMYDWKFSKKDGLLVGAKKYDFPRYAIEL